MTRLYIVRHAEAVEKDDDRSDAGRPLTDRGRRQFRRVAKALRKFDVVFDRLLHSPKLRAVETAEFLEDLVEADTIVTRNLAKPPSPMLLDEIRGEVVAVVGHEPYLGALAAWLLTGSKAGGGRFALKKGGILALDGDVRPGAMRLVCCMTPKILRALAKA
jgi:phosphohistidine phosphatase